MRNEVIKCLALIEALIDFGEGEDLEEGIYDQGVISSVLPLSFELISNSSGSPCSKPHRDNPRPSQ